MIEFDETFGSAFHGFLEKWTANVKESYGKFFENHTFFKTLDFSKGKRFVKVTCDHSVVAFIELSSGNIYKPASWNAPAKHVRGCIFSNKNGLEATNPNDFIFSINYMR